MSNENLALPAHLQNNDEAARQALQDAQSMSSASNSVPRISLRGREFRFIENGEEVRKVRDRIRVIILGVEPEGKAMIKAWYAKGYVSGSKEPPDCMSDDGISPSKFVQQKQSDLCATCPKNRFGSATSPSGKPTKACRDSKRIWVVEAQTATGNAPNGEPLWSMVEGPLSERTQYGLNVTVASLKSFAEMGRTLAGYGQSPCVAITEITMLDREFPELKFDLVGWLGEQTCIESKEINAKRPWRLFSSASLALENSQTSRPSLPLPSHLSGQAEVTDVKPREPGTPAPTNQQINDAVSDW